MEEKNHNKKKYKEKISGLREQYLKIPDVAWMLKVSESTVRNLIREGKLKYYRIGGQIRFNIDDMKEYLNACKQNKSDIINKKKKRSFTTSTGLKLPL